MLRTLITFFLPFAHFKLRILGLGNLSLRDVPS